MNADQTRRNWLAHVEKVIRSRHYAWIAEARDGDPIEDVMVDLLADVMHICQRTGIPWEELVRRSRLQYEAEEAEQGLVPA
jgi:hypothetical protein